MDRPFGLLAELTYACPLHCPYCSNPLNLADYREELTLPAALAKMHRGNQAVRASDGHADLRCGRGDAQSDGHAARAS